MGWRWWCGCGGGGPYGGALNALEQLCRTRFGPIGIGERDDGGAGGWTTGFIPEGTPELAAFGWAPGGCIFDNALKGVYDLHGWSGAVVVGCSGLFEVVPLAFCNQIKENMRKVLYKI